MMGWGGGEFAVIMYSERKKNFFFYDVACVWKENNVT